MLLQSRIIILRIIVTCTMAVLIGLPISFFFMAPHANNVTEFDSNLIIAIIFMTVAGAAGNWFVDILARQAQANPTNVRQVSEGQEKVNQKILLATYVIYPCILVSQIIIYWETRPSILTLVYGAVVAVIFFMLWQRYHRSAALKKVLRNNTYLALAYFVILLVSFII